jgi:hypothetical protein
MSACICGMTVASVCPRAQTYPTKYIMLVVAVKAAWPRPGKKYPRRGAGFCLPVIGRGMLSLVSGHFSTQIVRRDALFVVGIRAIDVIDVLPDLILRGIPAHIRSDNGPEFVAKTVQLPDDIATLRRCSPARDAELARVYARHRSRGRLGLCDLRSGALRNRPRVAPKPLSLWRAFLADGVGGGGPDEGA